MQNKSVSNKPKSIQGLLKFVLYSTVAFACAIGLMISATAYVLLSTPRPKNIRDCITTEMYHVKLCPKGPDYVRLKDISANVRNAVIVSEDGAFYSHQGIDWFEMRESFHANMEKGTFARGGSTITQQLAKNVYLSSEKSLIRKVREAMIALQLETILSKDEILEKYLNVVEFGPNLYGVGPASRHYFGKSASQLTPAEAAFLAFLLPSPKKYSVSFRKKQLTPFAHSRLREIVSRLNRYHKISAEDAELAFYQVDHFYGESSISPSLPESEIPSAEEQADPNDDLDDI
jgi:monofunctional biosynthetic peptidoglycan transglycosylase